MNGKLTALLATTLLLGCQTLPRDDAVFPVNAIAVTAHPVATDLARDIFARGGNKRVHKTIVRVRAANRIQSQMKLRVC